MKTYKTALFFLCALMMLSFSVTKADDLSDDVPLGVWNAVSMLANGSNVPDEAVKRIRITITNDTLKVRGNSTKSDKEEICTYSVDTKQSPKHLNFTPAELTKPILAIYEVKDNELQICIRNDRSTKGRPEKFASKPDSECILIILKKQESTE